MIESNRIESDYNEDNAPYFRAIDSTMKVLELTRPFITINNNILPAGTKTDFASTPRWLWSLIPPRGKYAEASMEHDYLYQKAELPRKAIDLLFLETMKKHKVNKIKRLVMYTAVRIFGGKFYNNYKKINEQNKRKIDKSTK